MKQPRAALLASFVLTAMACGGESQTRPAPIPPAPTVVAATSTAPIDNAPPPSSEPTALTEEQRARDKALAPKVEAILDAYANFEPSLSPDNKTLVFASNRGGLPEAYVADASKPGDAPKKIVAGPQRVGAVRLTRDGKYVLFVRDRDADENFHVMRVAIDGSGLTDLTPNEKLHRDEPILPLKKIDTMIYSARATTSPESKIFVQGITSGEPKLAFTDAGPSFAVDASPDATHALVVRFVSPSDQVLFDVDLVAGKSRRVYPADGKQAGVHAAAYSSDGKRIFVATNAGGETSMLLALDATSLAEKAKYVQNDPASSNIVTLDASPKGDRLAITIDAGHHTEVRMLDATSLALGKPVKAPLGSFVAGAFSADGSRFVARGSRPDLPPDIYVVDAATGAVKPLRDDKRAGLADLPAMTSTIEKTKAFDGLSIPINLYLPKIADPSRKLPTIVSFHGGPAASSELTWSFWNRFFTSQGFAVVEPNIRGSTGFGRAYEMADNREKRADAMKDVATVNAWAKSQPWCDADRVVIFGGSYGGYLVLMALTRQASSWRAGVDLVGISDLKTFLKSTDQAIRSAFVDEFGDLEKDAKLLEEYSPIRDVDKITAPLFVYQGQNDPRVPRPESDTIVRVMREKKIPVEYMVAMNEGHSIDHREVRVEFLTRVVRFLGDETKIEKR